LLASVWDAHRGRCYEDVLKFPDFLRLMRDALVNHGGSVQFTAGGFRGKGNVDLSLERVNEWNDKRRFSRAFVDRNGSGVLESDLDFFGGTNERIIEAFITMYELSIVDFGALLPAAFFVRKQNWSWSRTQRSLGAIRSSGRAGSNRLMRKPRARHWTSTSRIWKRGIMLCICNTELAATWVCKCCRLGQESEPKLQMQTSTPGRNAW